MLRFDFDITYIKGELNKVADCLSWYNENDTESDAYEPYEYVHTDARIDPMGEDLPIPRFQEITEKTIEIREGELRRSWHLQERLEERDIEARIMAEANSRETSVHNETTERTQQDDRGAITLDEDISLGDAIFQCHEGKAPATMADDMFIYVLRNEYTGDKLFQVVLENPEDYREFSAQDGII
jgi:hypothetical protein